MMVDQLPPGVRLAGLLALGLTYAVYSVRHQPPGVMRLLMSLPLSLLFTLAPFQFHESIIICGCLGFLFGWLINFKLLAFAADRGPLATPGLKPWQWLLLLLLPYYSAKRGQPPARAGRLVLGLLFKVALTGGLTAALLSPLADLHRALRHTGYALYVWLFASLVLDGPLPLGSRLLGHLRLQPAMNNPFVATSVREFWGRRYNQIVSVTLKDVVYDPIMEGRWVARRVRTREGQPSQPKTEDVGSAADGAVANVGHCNGGSASGTPEAGNKDGVRRRPGAGAGAAAAIAAHADATAAAAAVAAASNGSSSSSGSDVGASRVSRGRQLVAMWAAFAVSGVMHEFSMLYLCGGRLEGSFRMFLMFLLQPLIILAQDAAAAAVGRRVPDRIRNSRAAAALQTLLTALLVLASAEHLFWGPMESCRTDERGLAEIMGAMRAASGWCGGVAARVRAAAVAGRL